MLSPFKVIAIYFDHIKDFLVVIQLVLLSGGFYAVGENWHEFSSVVSILLGVYLITYIYTMNN